MDSAPREASGVERYDAVVVGSAVYMGRWLPAAVEFVHGWAETLATKPVWLFSSGPLDDSDAQALPAPRVDELVGKSGALGHHVFAGKLDRGELGWGERLVTRIVHAPDGDHRDWNDVKGWADSIADHLVQIGAIRSPTGIR